MQKVQGKTQKIGHSRQDPEAFLSWLNSTFSKLHEAFEDYYWTSYMGDHSVDKAMNEAQAARDAFRANPELKKTVEAYIKTSKGPIKERLKVWQHFFSLYQMPPEAAEIKKKITDLEATLMKKRSDRKEGYIDPSTKKFIEASENMMRTLMVTHPDEAVRKACFDAMEKLPLPILGDYVKLIRLRNDFAKSLGFSDFYEYKARIDEDMSKKELFSLFDKIYEKTKYAFKNIRKLEKDRPGLRKPWNFGYMMAGNFTKEDDPYFQFENVLEYWGRSFAALGIRFRSGSVTLDLLDRKGKWNNGFCHYPKLVQYKNGKRVPGSSNFSSNAIPHQMGSGVQGIHTVFHEGGHAADRLNSMQMETCVNTEYPPSSVSWAETHSMFMDTISSSVEWKVRYAKNDKGEPYPFENFEKQLKALYPLRPLDLMGLTAVVMFEKQIYECKNLTKEKVLDIAKKTMKKYNDRSEDSIRLLNVPHIYNFESSAQYHGYAIAELTVHQWRDYFFKKYGYIVDNPKVGEEFAKIWSYASLYPAKKLVKMATGKPLRPDTYIKNITMSLEDILKRSKERVARLDKVPRFTKPIDLDGTITMMHGKEKIADNSVSFEDMEKKYRAWLQTHK